MGRTATAGSRPSPPSPPAPDASGRGDGSRDAANGDVDRSTQPSAKVKACCSASPKRKDGVCGLLRFRPGVGLPEKEDEGRGPVAGRASRSSATPNGDDDGSTQPSAKVKACWSASPKRKDGVCGLLRFRPGVGVLEEEDGGRGPVAGRASRSSTTPYGDDDGSTQPSAKVKACWSASPKRKVGVCGLLVFGILKGQKRCEDHVQKDGYRWGVDDACRVVVLWRGGGEPCPWYCDTD